MQSPMPLQVEDIQGIILWGYGGLDSAYFVMLHIEDAALTKQWLRGIALRNGEKKPQPPDTCVNIAFTARGLHKLGLRAEHLKMLAGEFTEGMTGSDHRRRCLGDHGESSPERWRWGGPDNDRIHILLMLYAVDEPAARALLESHRAAFPGAGLRLAAPPLDSLTLTGRKEHFRFRDGISQPDIEGYDENPRPGNAIASGEFVLGYPNAYGQYTDRPTFGPAADPHNLL